MANRELQIDIISFNDKVDDSNMVRCNVYIDGRCCTFWTTKSNYEALLYDKVFIRDGKEKDSAEVLNTTNVFIEKI